MGECSLCCEIFRAFTRNVYSRVDKRQRGENGEGLVSMLLLNLLVADTPVDVWLFIKKKQWHLSVQLVHVNRGTIYPSPLGWGWSQGWVRFRFGGGGRWVVDQKPSIIRYFTVLYLLLFPLCVMRHTKLIFYVFVSECVGKESNLSLLRKKEFDNVAEYLAKKEKRLKGTNPEPKTEPFQDSSTSERQLKRVKLQT